ncbi:tRNA (adenine(58)-N(1))-methyltransferase non-catalytic subunit TRM6-like [Argiope bruennichi]|uniref:tRNA (adenine(58)-N(1))-methyltransferase non-catalytic subunit TRM6-like n=1 Tax=Argiope bruennichi TaxID=94029 RepID=UPI0024943010|nr:tRNA (adenine(58)-N(1))-methyltransferase non-catalytic subunit TRM6-like [Argiope bruennichi]
MNRSRGVCVETVYSYIMASGNNDSNIIREGNFVIVKTEAILRLVELKNNKPQYLGKRKARFFAAVGHPYGSFFEIKSDGSLIKLEKPVENLLLKVDDDGEAKDNRSLTDTGESQKLTTSDIEAFKKQGLSGQEMVIKIVENSSSFQDKTAFAKEKYLRKKQKKYLNYVQLLKPNIRLLAEMYYMQGPLKICNLRIDSLSQMLAFCNVMSGGKFMIMDTVNGLLTASVLERLGSEGCAVQLHLGPFSIHCYHQVIRALNITSDVLQTLLYNINVRNALSLLEENKIEDDDAMLVDPQENSAIQTDSSKDRIAKTEKKDHIKKVKELLNHKNMDSLLIAVKNHPLSVLQLLDFLSFSRPFAIFSMFQEPLVDCYVKLKSRGDIISLNISETWLRKYQVLPERTHPCYQMSGHGGFLLTGIKVAPKQ